MIKQMTLRRIPDSVEKALRKRAKESGRSLNMVSIDLLSQALGVSQPNEKKRDLSELCGMWNADELKEFKCNTETFNAIDPELWS
ncbi:MAG: hypothetical protein PF904_00445 [Kiritimatiellae bacterium]|jgi:plasmid stability protein|nr:hypothetical protein [Kiritimatiellia bacterium]